MPAFDEYMKEIRGIAQDTTASEPALAESAAGTRREMEFAEQLRLPPLQEQQHPRPAPRPPPAAHPQAKAEQNPRQLHLPPIGGRSSGSADPAASAAAVAGAVMTPVKSPPVVERARQPSPYQLISEVRVVKVDDLTFTQDAISNKFRDGKTLEELISGLVDGRYDPLQFGFLCLEVVQLPGGILASNDNRRLYCLKSYQDRVRAVRGDVQVRVHVTIFPAVSAVTRYLAHRDTTNHGKSVRVRGA